jgi:hypothetical protein
MEKEKVQKKEDAEEVKGEAQEYYEAESWQFSSCGD